MKHKIITIAVLASLLIVSCARAPEPLTPKLAIMVESNIIEADSSFMISGSNFQPGQKVCFKGNYSTSKGKVAYGITTCADENGLIHTTIDIPEDALPGDYEVEIYIGKHLDDRELMATLPIHIQARAK